MFDCDVVADFYKWSEPIARKEHRCCECNAPILKGEKHFYARGKWEDELSTFRQHLLCCQACMFVRDKLNDYECIPFCMLKDWYAEYARDFRKNATFKELVRMMVKIRRRERLGHA